MSDELKQQIQEKMVELNINSEESSVEELQSQSSESIDLSIDNQDPFLDEALKMGYNPDYQGNNKKSPEQFVKDGSFFRKIDSQNKKIDELLGVVKGLSEHNEKVAKASYEQGMTDALSRRREAIEAGDTDAFDKAEYDLRQLNSTQVTESKVSPVDSIPEVTQDMLDFVEANKSWFNNQTSKNIRMVKEADGLFTLESQDNPSMPQKEILQIVKDKIMLLHPDEFENPNKSKPMTVSKSSTISTKSTSTLINRLTDTQKKFYRQAADSGLKMTIEEYAKQLDMTGDLKND